MLMSLFYCLDERICTNLHKLRYNVRDSIMLTSVRFGCIRSRLPTQLPITLLDRLIYILDVFKSDKPGQCKDQHKTASMSASISSNFRS